MAQIRVNPWKRFLRVSKKPVWYAVRWLTGIRVQTPVHFLDMSIMGAEFPVRPEGLAPLIPPGVPAPVTDAQGFARLWVMAMEYRAVDVLYPYNEVAVTTPVRLANGQAHYYLHLPVTTEDARWPGIENYGFPKYIAEITFAEEHGLRRCELRVGGEHVLTLSVPMADGCREHWVEENLTVRDGELIRSVFTAEGVRASSKAPGSGILNLGDHPVGAELAATGVERSSLSHFYAPTAKAILSVALPAQERGASAQAAQ